MKDISVFKVYKKKDGEATNEVASWAYRFERKKPKPNGKRDIAYRQGFKTKTEATEAGRKAFNIEYGIIPDPEKSKESKFRRMQFECYVNNHWFETKLNSWKATTAEGYRKKLKNHIFPYIGNLALGVIDREALQNFFDHLYLETPLSVTTIENLRWLMVQIFKYAADNQHISCNPMANVSKPNTRLEASVKKNKQKRTAIPNEILETIFERFPEGTATYIPMKLCTLAGLRRGEAFGISWDDVDFNNHCIYVTRQLQRRVPLQELTTREKEIIKSNPELEKFGWYTTNPKYESKRVVPMVSELEEILMREKEKQDFYRKMLGKKYIKYYYTKTSKPIKATGYKSFNERRSDNDYENGIVNTIGIGYPIDFVNRRADGELITDSVTQHLSRVVRGKETEEAIYEDFNIHSLRHTFSSNMRAQNYPEHIIQELMGHKSPLETQTYMHLTEDEFSSTMARFTGSDSKDILTELLSGTKLTEDKLNAIRKIINN